MFRCHLLSPTISMAAYLHLAHDLAEAFPSRGVPLYGCVGLGRGPVTGIAEAQTTASVSTGTPDFLRADQLLKLNIHTSIQDRAQGDM